MDAWSSSPCVCIFGFAIGSFTVTDISQNQKKKAQAMVYSCLSLRIMGTEQIPLLVKHDDAVESTGGPGVGHQLTSGCSLLMGTWF